MSENIYKEKIESLTEIKNVFNTIFAAGQVKNIETAARMVSLYREIELAFYDAGQFRKQYSQEPATMPT